MALQSLFVSPYSAQPVVNAYHRIVDFRLSAEQGLIVYAIAVYESKAARDANKMPIGRIEIVYDHTTTPSFTQVVGQAVAPDSSLAFDAAVSTLYNLLKQREEYEGATDV